MGQSLGYTKFCSVKCERALTILPENASDAEILNAVRAWAALLAAEEYAAAFALVECRPHWTPELLRTVIRNYGFVEPMGDGSTYRVTPLESASGGPTPLHEVDRSDGRISVWFDLPLNGEWSDLTATFDLEPRDGKLALVLDHIHVF